jgi:hypothetical protein
MKISKDWKPGANRLLVLPEAPLVRNGFTC